MMAQSHSANAFQETGAGAGSLIAHVRPWTQPLALQGEGSEFPYYTHKLQNGIHLPL